MRKQGRGPILALSSSAVNNEFDELTPIGTPQQIPLSSRSDLAIATDRALSHDLRDKSPAPAPTLDLSAYEPKVRYLVARQGKVLAVDPYYPEAQAESTPVLHEINIGVKERSDSFASTMDDYGSSQSCFDIAASASSSLVTGSDKRMLVRPRRSQSALWDDRGLDERKQRAISYDEYFEQSVETPDWVYRTLSPDEQFRPELVELEPFGAPRLSHRLTLNAQANSVVQPGEDAANAGVGSEQVMAEQVAPEQVAAEQVAAEAVYEATGTNGYDAELAAFSGYTNYAQYYTQDGHGQGLEQVSRGRSRSERLTGQDSSQRYNAYANPALQGAAAFKDFSTPQDRSNSDFSSPKSQAAPKATPKGAQGSGLHNEFSANTMVSSAVEGGYQRQTQAQVLRPQLSHPELYERNTITTRKPGRTGPLAGTKGASAGAHGATAQLQDSALVQEAVAGAQGRAAGAQDPLTHTQADALAVGSYNPGYDGGNLQLTTLNGGSRYGSYDFAGSAAEHYRANFAAAAQLSKSAPKAGANKTGAANWREALTAARSGVPAAAITPDYVAALKGAQAARFTKPRRAYSLAHLQLPANTAYMPEDPHYVPTDSAIAFADQHAAYHQAFSHGRSVSRYAYGTDFNDDEGKARKEQLARARAQRQAALTQAAQGQDKSGQATSGQEAAGRRTAASAGFTTARDFAGAQTNTWWRDQGITEQSAQAAFSEENFHQGKHGSFIGTPEEFIPADRVQQVNTVNAQLVTTSAATIVTAPAPDATVITGDKALGNKSGQLYQSELESAPNDHTRIVYNQTAATGGLSANSDEQAEAYEAQRAQESFNHLGAVHHHPNAWDSAAKTQTAYFEDFVPGNAPSGDFADFSTADERRKRAQQQVASREAILDTRSSYDHSEQDPTHRKPKRLVNPQLPQDAVDVAAQAATSSLAQGFKPAPAVAAEVPERISAAPVYDKPSVPASPSSQAAAQAAHSTYVAHTTNQAYAAAAAQQARSAVQAAQTQVAPAEIYSTYGHKAQYGDFDAYGHDELISSSMVKGYAQQVSAYTAVSSGSGTGPYEPAHHGRDFSDFSTADGSKIEGEIKVPVTSQKQALSQRQAELSAQLEAERHTPAEPSAAQPAEQASEAERSAPAAVERTVPAAAERKAEAERAAQEALQEEALAAAQAQLRAEAAAKAAASAPEPKAKPTVSAAVQALAANLVATAAQEIDAEEQAAAEAKAAQEQAAAEAKAAQAAAEATEQTAAQASAEAAAVSANQAAAEQPGMSKSQLKRAKRRAKARSRGNSGSASAISAEVKAEGVSAAQAERTNPAAAAPATGEQASTGVAANATPAVSEQANTSATDTVSSASVSPLPASSSEPSAAEVATRAAQAQSDAAYLGGIVMNPSAPASAAPSVNPELMAQAEQFLKDNARRKDQAPNTESLDIGTARDEAPVLAPSELEGHSALQGLFAGVTPEDDDDVALDGLPNTEAFGVGLDQGFKSDAPASGFDPSEPELKVEPVAPPMPLSAQSQSTAPSASAQAERKAENKTDYAVNPVTGALSNQPRSLMNGGFNEHTVVVKAEYSLDSLDELHKLFSDTPSAMPQVGQSGSGADSNGFSNNAYHPIDAAAQTKRAPEERERQEAEANARAEAEAAEQARREQEERERQEAEAKTREEAAERARREQEERERQEAEAKTREEAAERARREQEERERQEAEAKAREEAAERARREQEERERQEAEAKARAEAEAAERARREQEERERQEAEAKARAEAEAAERARREQEERERQEAEAKARAEAAERARREQEERERQEAEAKARAEAEAAERARREQEERERQEAEAKARAEAAERARREQEERERQEAEAKAREEAAERARREQEERERQEGEAKAAPTQAETAQAKPAETSHGDEANVPENLLFAAPKRFVSGDGAEQTKAPKNEASTSGAAAVQAAVAGVLSSTLPQADSFSTHRADLMKATEEDFLGNSFSESEQSPKLEKASSTSSSLASLAAELIDDFDDPFGDDFAQSNDDEQRK